MTSKTNEEWKIQVRKDYRKQTLNMAREVSKSGTYEKVEGMICDWWFEKIDTLLTEKDKEREEAVAEEREKTIRDMERKMMGWAGTATAMLKDYRKMIYSPDRPINFERE